MKSKRIIFLMISLLLLLFAAGCIQIVLPEPRETADAPDSVTDAPEPSDDVSIEPAVTDPPQTDPPATDDPARPEQYRVDGVDIIRTTESGEYKVFEFNDWRDGWVYSIEEYIVEPDGVYIMIYGFEKDGNEFESSAYYLYGIKPDGTGRNKLKEIAGEFGYERILPYGDWLLIVEEGGDSVTINYAAKNGTQTGYLDFTDAAAQAGVLPYYNAAELSFENGLLYGNISFFTDEEPYAATYRVRIDKDLKVSLVEGAE
jgi:hypothetical protein